MNLSFNGSETLFCLIEAHLDEPLSILWLKHSIAYSMISSTLNRRPIADIIINFGDSPNAKLHEPI